MALIYGDTYAVIKEALSTEQMLGWRIIEQNEIIREGMQQLMPNGEWWTLDWRVSCFEGRACDFPHALAYRARK